jgi:HD domain
MPEEHDVHYLRHVTALGQKRPMVTTQAIYSQSGVKLLDIGVRVGDALHDKLIEHNLLRPIDECVSVEGAVSGASLRQDLEEMLLEIENANLPKLSQSQRERVLQVGAQMPLTPVLAFKLTVMREQRPQIYRHTLQVVLVAVFLATAAGSPKLDVTHAAAAALFHDMGQLHIDPAIGQDMRHLDETQLRYFDTHPITAYLILKTIPDWNPVVATAVLNHHERLDGSGYPRRLAGADLDIVGQLLAVADVGAAILWSKKSAAYRHLSVALRFSDGKLSAEFGQTLLNFLWGKEKEQSGPATTEPLPLDEAFRKVISAIDDLRNLAIDLPGDFDALPFQKLAQLRLDQLSHSRHALHCSRSHVAATHSGARAAAPRPRSFSRKRGRAPRTAHQTRKN